MFDVKKDRYEDEVRFFEKIIQEKIRKKEKFTLNNTKNYENLFNDILQLKKVVSFFGDIKGKKILDLGCGEGWASLYFARSGASVFCCDISPKSIELAKRYADANGLSKNIVAEVMVAEELKYKENFFDYVFMNAALHHCDIEKVATEIKRVLRPCGKAAIIDDSAYNPIMKVYRYFTKNKHTKYEKPLTSEDIVVFCKYFLSHEIFYYKFFNIFDKEYFFTNILVFMDKLMEKIFPKYLKYCKLLSIFVVK
jgi:ubiquinone/menaquinone biosynthesis C-methylase UbiE